MKRIQTVLVLCLLALSCSKNEPTVDNPNGGGAGGGGTPANAASSIVFENNSFSGSCIVTYSDGATYNGAFANGTMNIPSTGGNKVIASIQPQNQQLLIIGRKEGVVIKLNYNGTVLSHRTAVNGFVPVGTFAEFQLINLNTATLAGSYKQEDSLYFMNNVWTPIGTSNAPFNGTFDGNSKEINQINVSVTGSTNAAGLFGIASSNSQLSNIILASGNIKGQYYSAGIAAQCGFIVNCKNYARIEGVAVAGVAGIVTGINEVSNCHNYGNLISSGLIAGVISSADNSTIKNCTNNVNLNGSNISGIVGKAKYVQFCINNGAIVGSVIAGITANAETVVNSTNNGKITGSSNCSGIVMTSTNIVESCINNGVIECEGICSGIVNNAKNIKNCKNNGEIKMNSGNLYGISSNAINIEDCTNSANLIGFNAFECFGIGKANNGVIKNCRNSNKIFGKNLSGLNTIKLMGIGASKELINCHNTGELEAQSPNSTFNFNSSCSGIGGDVYTTTIADCSNSGKITTVNGNASGIISYNLAVNLESPGVCTISGCFNIGEIRSSASGGGNCGGITAYLAGDISKCYNTGNIFSNGTAGGIGAILNNPSFLIPCNIIDCYNTGNVSGSLLGISSNVSSGGLVGVSSSSGSITRCFNSGNISSSRSGGICGYINNQGYSNNLTKEIKSCYNTGTITGQRNGGILGEFVYNYYSWNYFNIKNCYNIGNCTAGILNLGGSLPNNLQPFTLTNSYWKQGTSTYAVVGISIPSTNVGANLFSATAWPSAATGWTATDWKSLGSWNNGNPTYPKLIFEN